MHRIYLDHQATTPVLPEVWEAMKPFFAESFGSPSSLHRLGLQAREALAGARERVAALVHAESPENILFTSGATEAANLAVAGTAWANRRRGDHLVLTGIEHPSVVRTVEFLEKQGFTATRVRVDGEGFVSPEAVRAALTDRTILVCVHHANHDIGTLEPIREIGAVTAEKGVPLFVDAAASGGWEPIDAPAMGAQLLSLSPHRFYGPKGVGVLYRHRRARLAGVLHGGVQEGGLRPGTENVPAIVGAGVAAEVATRELSQRRAHVAALQRRLWEGLRSTVPYLRLNGPEPGPGRLATNLNVSLEFVEGEGLALMLDMQGVAVASGPSCVSGSLKVSPVLAGIGLDHVLAQGNVLFSLGRDNTAGEIDSALGTFARVVERLRGMSPQWDAFQRGETVSVISGRPSRGRGSAPSR